MSRNPEDFVMRPLVYGALSGEFKPPTDPEQRLHTLGQLAIETVTMGALILEHEGRDGFSPVFTYRPSWAPDVTAQVAGEFLPYDGSDLIRMVGIYLEGESDRGLYVGDESNHRQGVRLQIDDSEQPGSGIYYDLALSAKLHRARADVAKAAQEFFSAQV